MTHLLTAELGHAQDLLTGPLPPPADPVGVGRAVGVGEQPRGQLLTTDPRLGEQLGRLGVDGDPATGAGLGGVLNMFTGGAIGVLTALYLVEVNNVEAQAKQRCFYCSGSGYLGCGSCAGSGRGSGGMRCAGCGGSGKVMCTSCLCTGRLMATEHDQRIDPFE